MFLSKACEYGIRAVLYITASMPAGYLSIRTISNTLGIPYYFLAKIVQALTPPDILTSHRGPNGGVALARPASEITLKEVVLAIDGPSIFTECVLGLPGCGERKPCPLHEAWSPTKERIGQIFEWVSLAEMTERISEGDFRLATLLPPAEE